MKFFIEDRANGFTWVRVHDHRGMQKMVKWCRDTGCGKQVNFYTLSFNKEQELTAFLLRWQGQE